MLKVPVFEIQLQKKNEQFFEPVFLIFQREVLISFIERFPKMLNNFLAFFTTA